MLIPKVKIGHVPPAEVEAAVACCKYDVLENEHQKILIGQANGPNAGPNQNYDVDWMINDFRMFSYDSGSYSRKIALAALNIGDGHIIYEIDPETGDVQPEYEGAIPASPESVQFLLNPDEFCAMGLRAVIQGEEEK
jgi:hypothetical protein